MRKLLFISLLFCASVSYGQGLKLTGQPITNVSDSLTLTALYSYPTYCYNLSDSSLSITFPISRSVYAAKNKQTLTGIGWNTNISSVNIKSSVGIPTDAYLLSVATTYLNALGYTVTTF